MPHCNILLSALATVMAFASIMPFGEDWTCGDSLGRMKQLGMLPTPATGPAMGGIPADGIAR